MKKLCTLHDAASNLIEDMAPNSGRIEWKRNRLGLSGGSIDTDLFNGDVYKRQRLTMSVAQQGYEMGYMAVEAVVNALNGETIEEFIDSGADVVTAENAQERKDTLQGYLDAVA